MRLLVLLALCTVIACCQKPKFDKKVTTLVTTYLGANEPKATTLIFTDLVAQKTWDQITDNLMKNAISLVPTTKMMPAMAMLSTFNSCLQKAGVTTTDAMSTLSKAFKKILNKPYNAIINKMKMMTKNKKTDVQKTNQAYTIATSVLTKKLVQNMINTAKTASTQAAWNCAIAPLNTVMLTSQYNMDWTQKSG